MSLGDYYWLLVWRAFGPRFDRARRIHFSVGMGAEVILLAALLFLPPASVKMFEQIRAYGWMVAFIYLIVAFLIALGRESHELHLETLARIPDFNRAGVRDGLRRLILECDRVLELMDRYRPGIMKDEMFKWKGDVEAFLRRELGEPYARRLAATLSIDDITVANEFEVPIAVRNARGVLDDIMTEYA